MNPELAANGTNCRGNAEVPRRLAAERAPSDRVERHILRLIAELLPKPPPAPA